MTQLKKGEPARPFRAEDLSGNRISLEDYKGKKLMLSFYRYASCIFCNLRVHQLIGKYDELHSNGLEMLAFFQSPKERILEYVGRQNAPFTIIPDSERKIYKMYGVESSVLKFLKAITQKGKIRQAKELGYDIHGKKEGKITLVPADFLINEDQTIHTAYYGKNISDHLPIREIEEFLN